MDKLTTDKTSVSRIFAVVRALARQQTTGARVTQIAQEIGLTQATTHRLLQSLIQQHIVEQDAKTKLYRLGLELFILASQAGNPGNLKTLCQPALLRLSASIGDSIFLLARSGFDAVCLDRTEGPYAIRTFTGDIGGRIALGLGQAGIAILAHLPEAEREEVIRYNLPRLRDKGQYDEVYLRTELERARTLGYVNCNTGLLEGMAGVAVAICDQNQRAVAALSVGTLASRLNEERLPFVIAQLQQEAASIAKQLNPFGW